ncbi:MAG: DinB family protein [Sphingobacteriales bacterium]|nr:DinB family protein [Sphingobacteriales bacterium]
MNKEITTLSAHMEKVLYGEPWFGRSVFSVLEETDENNVHLKPGGREHSLCELLWHMITWAEFTLKRVGKVAAPDPAALEKLDWRPIDPGFHTWKKGVTELKSIHTQLVALLREKEDSFLDEKVDNRSYDFRFLLNGLTEHTIYHLGQIAYLQKLLR